VKILRRHFRSSDDSIQHQLAGSRRSVRPECEASLIYVGDTEDTTEYPGHVDVVDADVGYVLGSDEQFVNQVPGDDVRRAGLVRRVIVEREFGFGQFPLAVPVDVRADVERAHDAACQVGVRVVQQVEQVRQVDNHVVIGLEQVRNTWTAFVYDLETE